jgi:hypothetical protein
MNVAQIVRLAAYQAKAVKQSLAFGPSVLLHELYALANDANQKIEQSLRAMGDDYFVRPMNSLTDVTAQLIMGISYTPSTSLRLAAAARDTTLPPDFLSLRSIRCVTPGYEDTRFNQEDITNPHFQALLRDTNQASPGDDLYYDIGGERKFYLAQPLSTALDIEILYVARTKRLSAYSTGTVTVVDASTGVVGAGTVWLSGSPFDSNYLDIHFGATGVATVPIAEPDYEYDYVNRGRVATIGSDIAIIMAAGKAGALAAGTGYLLASVPVIPEDFHWGIADYVTARILMSDGAAKAQGFFSTFKASLDGKVNTLRRPGAEVETVEDWIP